jgi:hypothetical protein
VRLAHPERPAGTDGKTVLNGIVPRHLLMASMAISSSHRREQTYVRRRGAWNAAS